MVGDGGRKVGIAGADDVEVDGALEAVASDGADGGGVLVDVDTESSEKKVGAGAGKGFEMEVTFRGPSLSRETLALPLLIDGGRNIVEVSSVAPTSLSVCAECSSSAGLFVWNTSPGPPPPPSTRSSFFFFTGRACFGAGSMPSKEDLPAP